LNIIFSLHGHSISPAHSSQVTLRFLASPINPADINQIQGVYPNRPPFTSDLSTPEPSAVGGNEGVAEVIAVGSKVKSVAKGDWVVMKKTGFGTWRSFAQADESQVSKIEDKEGLTPIQVGTVSVNPCTAYNMLKNFTRLDPGQWWIQNGANSGVGRAAIQMGRQWGYKSINIIRNRPGVEEMKAELKELGADIVLTEDELMEKGFKDQVKEWTNGGREQVGLALNCVGGKPTTAMAKILGFVTISRSIWNLSNITQQGSSPRDLRRDVQTAHDDTSWNAHIQRYSF
jgi:mitochondrial enoyl-[acyl-carrier protein] reductase / trans-2-enoyl-CoA reductase